MGPLSEKNSLNFCRISSHKHVNFVRCRCFFQNETMPRSKKFRLWDVRCLIPKPSEYLSHLKLIVMTILLFACLITYLEKKLRYLNPNLIKYHLALAGPSIAQCFKANGSACIPTWEIKCSSPWNKARCRVSLRVLVNWIICRGAIDRKQGKGYEIEKTTKPNQPVRDRPCQGLLGK